MRKINSVVLFGLISAFIVPLDCLASSKLIDSKDEFTDERKLLVGVVAEEQSVFENRLVAFYCREGVPVLGVEPGLMFHIEKSIQVKIRFDQKPMEPEMSFMWNDSMAIELNNGAQLLEKFLKSDRLIMKVGDSDTMRFDLRGVTRGNLLVFKERCEKW